MPLHYLLDFLRLVVCLGVVVSVLALAVVFDAFRLFDACLRFVGGSDGVSVEIGVDTIGVVEIGVLA